MNAAQRELIETGHRNGERSPAWAKRLDEVAVRLRELALMVEREIARRST
jgi:hypothetical protein